jgi:hypothetical protein
MAATKRRARGEDSICYDRSRDRWTGTITVGWKPDGRQDRIIVRGRTKTEVKDKLRAKAHRTCRRRPHTRHLHRRAVPEGLAADLEHAGRDHRDGLPDDGQVPDRLIGSVKLADLKVRDVWFALGTLAERLSTRSVRLARMILIQAIRNAMVNDLAVRNVADLTAVPTVDRLRTSGNSGD